jgi:hypothetical protein
MKSRRPPDLLLALLPAGISESPQRAALAYCFISLASTIAAASIEGLFIHGNRVEWSGKIYLIHPLCLNFSTLIDFALLNPLMIMYLLRARFRTASLNLTRSSGDRRLAWFQSTFCLTTASIAIAFYFQGFLQGTYFDAVVAISKDGRRLITVTGWLVFFWTAIILYLLLQGVVAHISYTRTLLRLRAEDIPYNPLHEDQSGGLKKLADPALDFLKAMVLLFLAFVVFAIYDILIFHIHESKRLWALAAYVAITFPLFLVPIIHLHKLMKQRRGELWARTLESLKSKSKSDEPDILCGSVRSYKELLEEIEAVRELRAWLATTPAWPLPIATLIRVCTYMLGVITPLVPKAMPVLLKALGFGLQ